MSWSTKQDMRSKLVLWLLQPIMFSERQKSSSSYFASQGKINTAQKMYAVHHNTFSDQIQISFFKNRIGSDSKIPLSDHLCKVGTMPQVLKSLNNVASFFFNTIHWLPIGLRVKHGDAKLVSSPERSHLGTPFWCTLNSLKKSHLCRLYLR